MKYVFLNGENLKNDIGMIKAALEEDPEVVFIFTHSQMKLFSYIELLRDEGLENNFLYNFRVCYEKQNMDLTYFDKNDSEGTSITSISKLVEILDKRVPCKIIVNDNMRTTLAEIVQQLIYIEYPVSFVNILLESEAKDEEKIKRFMEQSNRLSLAVKQAMEQIQILKEKYTNLDSEKINKQAEQLRSLKERSNGSLENVKNTETISGEERKEFLRKLEKAEKSCRMIQEKLNEAQNLEMKIAVAASKKTGKSMIINSMIEEELAPTSLELATPNICIYKKSMDAEYHLTYQGEEQTFQTAEGLYQTIGIEFRKAQEDKKHNYRIEDMEIEYVSNGNCFENVTILDTPGPDAAGMECLRSVAAEVRKCDVAIFAIDFTKYLTTSEEEYLRRIKEEFTKNGKFASLIFVINKMDMVYTDANTAKSVIKSIDYIRNRLGEINEDYKNCIIFATSALQYFRTIECEKGCGRIFINSDDLYSELRPMKKRFPKYKDQLTWLDGQVGHIESSHNVMNITAEMLKQRSGIPGLLNYVSYVTRIKGREEIVNNVTVLIDTQVKQLQSILDYITNIESMINLNQDQIQSITSIVEEYKDRMDRILTDRITEEELVQFGQNSIIKDYIGRAEKVPEFEAIKYGIIDQIQKNKEDLSIDLEMVNQFFTIIQEKTYESFVNQIRENTREGKIEKDILDEIVEELISPELIQESADDVISSYYGEEVYAKQQEMDQIQKEIEAIINGRIQKIRSVSEECGRKLEKYATFSIPKMPEFTVSLSNPEDKINISQIEVGEEIQNGLLELQNQVLGKKVGGLLQSFHNMRGGGRGHVLYYVKEISKENYKTEFEKNFYRKLCDLAGNHIKFQKHVKIGLDRISFEMESMVDRLADQFFHMNEVCRENIQIFISSIDERKRYYADIDALERQKKLVEEIHFAANGVFRIWDYVVSGSEK